ncbi:MAG: hypothetical protein V4471_03870 [Pseudomonadota bacterium]
MHKNESYPINFRENFIKSIQKTLSEAGLAIQEYNECLREIGTKTFPELNECLKYLFKNNSLTDNNFKQLFFPSERNRLSISLKLKLLKELHQKNLLNQHNLDNIFYNPALHGQSLRNVIKALLKENLITQDNLDKILLHTDVANLIKVIDIFYPAGSSEYGIVTQDFLDKITSQNDLARFSHLLSYISDSIWLDSNELLASFDKLIHCNNKLDDQKIVTENKQQLDYSTIAKGHIDRILDKCNVALTSQAAADVFNRDEAAPLPIDMKYAAIIKNAGIADKVEQGDSTSLSLSVQGIDEASQSKQLDIGKFLLLLNYGFFKITGVKNDFISNNRSTEIESVTNFKANRADIIDKKLGKAIELYENVARVNSTRR